MRRGTVNPRSWDAAIRAVQRELQLLPSRVALKPEGRRMLAMVNMLCEEVTARKYLFHIARNRELAAKYGISERTVRNWRREDCPFAEGQRHVLKWMARRRYVPVGTKAKFGKRLEDLKWKALLAQGPVLMGNLRHVKWMYREAGEPPPDWLRNVRAKRGKLQFFDPVTHAPLETSLNDNDPASVNS